MTGLDERWPRLRAAWRGSNEAPLSRDERRRVVHGIAQLSAGLTRERALAGARYLDDPALLGAYLLFYWPRSYAQAASVLGELGDRPLGHVLDVGAGPLPLTWAAVDRGATSVLALDREPRALQLGMRIGDAAVTTRTWDAERGDPVPEGPFDTIMAGHVLNELWLGARAVEKRAALVEALLRRLAPGGRLVVLEPALRDTSRALLQLRDRLTGVARIVAPCLHQAACPALVRETDWCHAERASSPPAELAQLAAEAKLHADALKMSYLVLAREPALPVDARLFRIVSEQLPQKGKDLVVGCGPGGRTNLVLASRDRTAATEVFADLARGDVVRVDEDEQKGDGLRVRSLERVARVGDPPP